jgi:crotonobetainyl-CoA:carnitine CoA-transferase CaiB-like acyl-CoA transferase
MTIKTEQTTGPLNGFKILDFTRTFAGPYATMMLADMGATVIKVEPPEGDPSRQLGPYLNNDDKDCGLGGFNSSVNRNKRSISLNLKNPDAQKVAQEIAKECDALILNFSTPKIMSKYNLDYDTIKKINPKIVYVSISGYGTTRIVSSLHEGKPTIDMMMQAESGTLSITGSPDGECTRLGRESATPMPVPAPSSPCWLPCCMRVRLESASSSTSR